MRIKKGEGEKNGNKERNWEDDTEEEELRNYDVVSVGGKCECEN